MHNSGVRISDFTKSLSWLSGLTLLSAALIGGGLTQTPAAFATPLPDHCLTVFPPEEPVANGEGVRVVTTPAQLTWLTSSEALGAPALSAHLLLGDDIDLQACLWPGAYQPGGVDRLTRTTVPEGFSGILDGDGYTISNFVMTSGAAVTDESESTPLGFFDAANGDAIIRDITFDDVTVTLDAASFGDVPSHYATGIVVGDFGGETGANPTVSDVTVSNASISLSCDSPGGCVLPQVGGLVGSASRGTLSNISIDGAISMIASDTGATQTDGEGRVVSLLPGASSLQTAGLLAGVIGPEVTALDVSTSGRIESTVSVSNIGGLVGDVGGGTVTRGHSSVDIYVGDFSADIPTQVVTIENIGGAIGMSRFGSPTLDSVSSSGDIVILVAAFQENDPDPQTIAKIGGLIGLASDSSSVSDTRTESAVTLEVRDFGNTQANVSAQAVGGLIGRAEGLTTVTRSLALGAVNVDNVDGTTTLGDIGAFMGDVVDTPTVTQSYWDSGAPTVLTSGAGVAKTPAELSTAGTFATWSLETAWIDNWTTADAKWGLCEGSLDAPPFLQWRTTEDPCPASPSTPSDTSTPPRTTVTADSSWFQVGPVTLGFPATVGDQAAGTPIAASGAGMQPGSPVVTQVRSTPMTLSRVVVSGSGGFESSSSLPAMTPGNHRLLIDGVDGTGKPWLISVGFGIDSSGRFSWVGTPELSTPQELARTGTTFPTAFWFTAGLTSVLAGLGVLLFRRQTLPNHPHTL